MRVCTKGLMFKIFCTACTVPRWRCPSLRHHQRCFQHWKVLQIHWTHPGSNVAIPCPKLGNCNGQLSHPLAPRHPGSHWVSVSVVLSTKSAIIDNSVVVCAMNSCHRTPQIITQSNSSFPPWNIAFNETGHTFTLLSTSYLLKKFMLLSLKQCAILLYKIVGAGIIIVGMFRYILLQYMYINVHKESHDWSRRRMARCRRYLLIHKRLRS